IDHGWRLFGSKRRENYDDWWRCEVSFEPDLDECFGVTHSKQGVSPTPYIGSILEPDLEATARVLNARARATFGTIKRAAPSAAAARATRQDNLLPPVPRTAKTAARRGGFSYRIASAPIPGPDFFEVVEDNGSVRVTINTDHPFYERLYAPAASDQSGQGRFAIECLLLAAGRACLTVSYGSRRDHVRTFREAWSNALA